MLVDARVCGTKSQTFRGLCFRSSKCALKCQAENFESGKCKGLRRRCICIKSCDSQGPPGEDLGDGALGDGGGGHLGYANDVDYQNGSNL